MIESTGRRCRSSHLLDQPRYHHLEPPGRRPYPNCSVGRRSLMSSRNNGGRYSTTHQCRRRQCSQSSLSLLAPYRVDLPCHWCGGCLAAGAGLVVADLLTRPRVPCCCPNAKEDPMQIFAIACEWRSRRKKPDPARGTPPGGDKNEQRIT